MLHHLRLVDDHHELLGSSFDHLLPEERPSSAFHEVETRVDLVGAVYGEVDDGMRVEVGERDVERESMLLRLLGRGYPDDVLEFALPEKLADAVDGVFGGGAGAEAEDHVGFDEVDGFVSGDSFELVFG